MTLHVSLLLRFSHHSRRQIGSDGITVKLCDYYLQWALHVSQEKLYVQNYRYFFFGQNMDYVPTLK